MKRPKSLFTALTILLVAVPAVLALILAGFALVPPRKIRPEVRSVADQSAYRLNEKVGWYQGDDGSLQMVTWGSDGGLTMNDFAGLKREYLKPLSAELFRREGGTGEAEGELTFRRDPEGRVVGMTWTGTDGREHRAERVDRYGYEQAEVRFHNGPVELVGLLLTPMSPGPHPALVFAHGSGRSVRNFWYLYLADYLARKGVVVLLPDKRGCGASGGDWISSSFEDYADDVLAGVSFLGNVPTVDPERIGLLGVSQGGFVLPLAANKAREVRFLVSVSGSAATLESTLRHEITEDIVGSGGPRWLVPLIEPVASRRARLRHGEFWRINGSFDPLPHWRGVTIPVLFLNGEKDRNLPVHESVARLETLRKENPSARITIRLYGESGHGLEDPQTGWIRAECLASIVDWIQALGGC